MNDGEMSIQHTQERFRLTPEQSMTVSNYAITLYKQGLFTNQAIILIQKYIKDNYNKEQKDAMSALIFNRAKREYLQALPMLGQQEAVKEAVEEMERLETDIQNNTTNTPKKYEVMLETKKHKHNLLGLNKNNGIIEINIGTDSDNEFLTNQNKELNKDLNKVEVIVDAIETAIETNIE